MEFFAKGDSILSVQNVALFSLIRSKQTKELFLLANCHLLFNRDRGDIKLFQAALIMAGLKEISKQYKEAIYCFWGGDFNTVAQSPLYNFIRYASIEDLKKYKEDSWAGQYSGINVHTKLKTPIQDRLQRLAFKFCPDLQGKYLNPQSNGRYFDKLYEKLARLGLKIEGEKILIVPSDKATPLKPTKLKSAYAEDYFQRLLSEEDVKAAASLHGEMTFSTVPIQDPYPVTVDFLL